MLERAGTSSWRCASLGDGQRAAAGADHHASSGGDQGGETAAAGSAASDTGLLSSPAPPLPPSAQAPRAASSVRRQRRAGTVLLDQSREGSPRRRSRGTQILDQLSSPPVSAAAAAGGTAAAAPQRRRRASQRTASAAAVEAAAPLQPAQEPAPQLPPDGFLPGRGQHVLMATAVLEPTVAAAAAGSDAPGTGAQHAADQQLQTEPRARRQGRRRSMQFGFDPTVDLLGLEGQGPATAADEAALRDQREHEQRQERQRLRLEQQLKQQMEEEQQQQQQQQQQSVHHVEQPSLQWQEQQHAQEQSYQSAAPAEVPAVQQPGKVQRRGRKVSRTVVVPADAAAAGPPPPAPPPPPPPPPAPLPLAYTPLASAYHQQRPASRSSTSGGRRQSEASLLSELTEALWEEGIRVEGARFDRSQRLVCPKCGGGSSRELSLSATLKRSGCAVWNCFRATCGHSGAVRAPGGPAQEAGGGGGGSGDPLAAPEAAAAPRVGRPRVQRPDTGQLRPLSPDLVAWFGARGISPATLAANGVAMEHRFMPGARAAGAGGGAAAPGAGACVPAIAFPYSRAGEVVNIKYRALPKAWSQTKGGEQILYGIDDVAGREEVIIVEGELDKLALYEAGITHAASVPSGAVPPKRAAAAAPAAPAAMPDPAAIAAAAAAAAAAADRRAGSKFAFLRRAEPALAAAARIIIATDADAPGQALAEELARRLGRGRCLLLTWPAGCKDANDALLALGREGLARWVATAAVPMPPPSAGAA